MVLHRYVNPVADEGFSETGPNEWNDIHDMLSGSLRNYLINPDGRINQRLAASTADDVYAHDRWYALTQTGGLAASTLADPEQGMPYMIRIVNPGAAQRIGYAQIIEGRNCKHLRGKSVVLSGRIRTSSTQAIRYAILEWTGTEDAPTSDVVNSWTSGTYTAGNFFISTTLVVRAVGSITPTGAVFTNLAELTAVLGTTFTNLYVFIWSEGTLATSSVLDIFLQLEEGAKATDREFRPYGQELLLCQRYFEKSYAPDVAPGTVTNLGVWAVRCANFTLFYGVRFQVPKRAVPTVTGYSGNTGASGKFYNVSAAADVTVAVTQAGVTGYIENGAAAADQAAEGHYTASAEL